MSSQCKPAGGLLAADLPGAPSGVPGLVKSPITAEPALAGLLRFPRADLVVAAASMFWAVDAEGRRRVASPAFGLFPARMDHEGPVWRVRVGPGLVGVSRRDYARANRTAERARAAERREVDLDVAGVERGGAVRGVVRGWSADSRRRLVETVCGLDLSPIVAAEGTDALPCMVTLTLPADWLAVAPSAKKAFGIFRRFRDLWRQRYGALRCLWKREFQRRGAPHWHLWLVPPVMLRDMRGFRSWLSRAWTRAVYGAEAVDAHGLSTSCSCGMCAHWRAGSGVDVAEGLRASDPKRLAIYFLKESGGGESKAYQNEPPSEWAGQSVGRYWGVLGLAKAVSEVVVSPQDGVRAVRYLRRWRKAHRYVRAVRTLRVDQVTGEIRYRRSRRRSKVGMVGAGWVAANDGPGLAYALARALDLPH